MIEPRVIYACNHYVVESFDENTALFMDGTEGRSTDEERYSRVDTILPNGELSKDGIININSINCCSVKEYVQENNIKAPLVSPDCEIYVQGEHFDTVQAAIMTDAGLIQKTYIKWYSDVTPPEMYLAEFSYTRTVSGLYEANQCPRCGGEGWYAGIFEDGHINPSVVSGGNKLIQDFLKYIYTKKMESGYGSRITSIPGKYNMSDTEIINIAVQSELMSFKDYYNDKISAAILNGVSISDSEKLVSQAVSDIEIDESNRAIKVTVTFATKDGSLSSADLMIANL